jgi:hypothetical protein
MMNHRNKSQDITKTMGLRHDELHFTQSCPAAAVLGPAKVDMSSLYRSWHDSGTSSRQPQTRNATMRAPFLTAGHATNDYRTCKRRRDTSPTITWTRKGTRLLPYKHIYIGLGQFICVDARSLCFQRVRKSLLLVCRIAFTRRPPHLRPQPPSWPPRCTLLSSAVATAYSGHGPPG